MHIYDVIKRPVVTEKSNAQTDANNSYTFVVDRRANKMQVKDAVQTAFNVKVLEVNITNIPAKMGHYGRRIVVKKPAFKKAVVKVAPGNSITFFEGV